MTGRGRLAVAFVLVGAVAGAQTPRFPAGADVVSVDVSVVDGDGRPVRGLTAADFVVEVDGRPRGVRSADFVDFEMAPAAPTAATTVATTAPAMPAADDAARPPSGRLILIAVDRGEISVGGIRIATDALKALLERLAPADRVAVISLPDGPRLEFTVDRAAVAATLDQVAPDREDVIASALPLRERLDTALRSAVSRLDTLEAVLAKLVAIPGPKSLVFVSGGITAVDSGLCRTRDNGKLDCGPFGLSTTPSPNVVSRLRRIATTAAASRTTFYTMFVSQRGRDGISEKSYYTYLDPLSDLAFRQTTVETLTTMSGGALLEVVAGADRAVARVASEMSGQYVLGLEPADGDRDGKPHDIKVKVDRPGVTVRSRRQFVISPPKAPLPSVPASTVASADAPPDPSAPTPPGATRSDHVRRMEDARRLAGEGDRLLEAESFEDAAKAYANAITLEPMYFMAHYGLGRARMRQKDYPAAIAAFEQARRVFEERTEIVRGRRAARDAERAARLAASQATRSTRGASGTAATGRGTADLVGDAADPGFSTVTEPIPELPPGLTLALGSAYFRSGRIADAEREYRAALAAEPKLGEARINLAVVLLMTGKAVEAKEQIALAKQSGAKVPAGLENDVDAAIAKGKAS